MATITPIDVGAAPNDGTGDPLRTGFQKVNANEAALNAELGTAVKNGDETIQLDPSPPAKPAYSEGLVFYDPDSKTLAYFNDSDDVTVNIGQELILRCANNTGSAINNGDLVRITGVLSGDPTIAKSLADTVDNSVVAGMATEEILDGETGYITVVGRISGLDTSAQSPGDAIYLSDTVAGGYQTTKPVLARLIGYVTVSDVNDGQILLRVTPLEDVAAIAQNTGTGANVLVDNTPQPLIAYGDNVLSSNVDVSLTGIASPYRTSVSPATLQAQGFYKIIFNISITGSSSNGVHTFEVYRNGAATGFKSEVDLTNNNTDGGSASLLVILENVLQTDSIEIYHYSTDTGSYNANFVSFSVERVRGL